MPNIFLTFQKNNMATSSSKSSEPQPGPSKSKSTATSHIEEKESEATDMSFSITNYQKDVLKMMSMMRCHQMLTDVTLVVGSQKMPAHKVMLAAASVYFKAMFTGGLKECEMSEVTLRGVSPATMAILLNFIYTGDIRITELNVCRLLPAATMFQVTDVIKACCIFLERQLTPANAIGIANFAEQHGCIDLQEQANKYILNNFSQVCEEEEFMQLNPKQLVDLIRRDDLFVREEREVYNAVIRWVKAREDERQGMMHCVLSAVRCQYLTPSFLNEQMKNCEVIKKLPACREYLAQIFKDLTLHKKPSICERSPSGPRVIYLAGGYQRVSLSIVEALSVDGGLWTKCAPLTVPRSGLGATFVKGMLYAIGGRNTTPGCSYDSDWVDRYDPQRDLWRACNPMSIPRHRLGVGVIDGHIYAVGGTSGDLYCNSVERYDPDEDKWTAVASMECKRLGVGVAVVNRLLYAIGGFDGKNRLNSVEKYDPDKNAWTQVSPMQVARSGAGVVNYKQYIYVAGGFDNDSQLSSVECYDTEHDLWRSVAPLPIARSAIALSVVADKIYAIGGYDGHQFLSSVDVYDVTTGRWSGGPEMTTPRSGLASAVSCQPTSG